MQSGKVLGIESEAKNKISKKGGKTKIKENNESVDKKICKNQISINFVDDDGKAYKINPVMADYMNQIIKKSKKKDKEADELFEEDERLVFINNKIKSNNKCIFDKYNLIIKRNDFGKENSAFGWVWDMNHEPINIHINKVLLDTNSDDITIITLQQLKNKFPTLFTSRGLLYKVYTKNKELGIDVNEL